MPSTAVHRLTTLLEGRQLDRTLTSARLQTLPRGLATGVARLDGVLQGGWPAGEISEIVGRQSSGRTAVLMATLAAATRQGGVVGLVDAFDRFDPRDAAAAGVDLERVLWARGASLTIERHRARATSVWDRAIVRALRAFDLIIRAGGFAVAALDVGDVPAGWLRGLPHTTWMRLAHANEGRDTVALLVGEGPMGKSARGTSLRLEASAAWTGDSRQARRFSGFVIRPTVVSASLAAGRPSSFTASWSSHVLLSGS
jgi:RecA DNA recombination protein